MLNKYRPKTFDEFIGNNEVKISLLKAKNKLPIMFIGNAGTGKTTLAYILANKFETPNQNIEHYNCFDQMAKVDNVRNLVDNWNRPTLYGSQRTIIFDEIHGMSKAAQQELLIPLENLPSNVLAIACTTSLDKVQDALITRFIKYILKPLSDIESKELLIYLCEQENINLTKPIMNLILEESEGIPRNILVILEKVRKVQNLEEAKMLAEVAKIEDSSDVLELYKKMMYPRITWDNLKESIVSTLKSKSAESVRIGLVKILISRLTSKYFSGNEEGKNLIKVYEHLNYNDSYTTSRENLIMAIYRIFLGI